MKVLVESALACPKCGGHRVHRSRRRGPAESLAGAMGAVIRRCHDCGVRRAYFGKLSFAMARAGSSTNQWTGLAVLVTSFAVCLAIVWLMITRMARPGS